MIAFAKPQAEDLSDEDYERYQLPLDLANLPDGPDGSKILLTQEYIRTRLASFRREGNIEEIQIALLTGTNGTEGEHVSIQKWQRQPSGEVLATDERVWIEPWEIPALIAALEAARADHQGPEGVSA